MQARLFSSLALLFIGIGIARGAPDTRTNEWKLPKAEADKWAARIRKIVPDKGWTVTIRGNDIIVQREKAVRFAAHLPNAAPDQAPQLSDGDYRVTLRFAPKMSYDEYETRVAENAAMDVEQDKLQKSISDISHKFDDYLPRTDKEKERVKKYHEAVRKLVRHTLPDLYTPDHSIHVFQSWSGFETVADKDVSRECEGVEQGLLRYFGVYNPQTAAQGSVYWRMEARPQR